MNKNVTDIAAFINRFADRFRNAEQADAERHARLAAKAVLLADDPEIAETVRGILVRRWMAQAVLPVSGGSPNGSSEYDPPDTSSTNLSDTINNVLSQPDVQPGYPDANGNTNTTWCNRAAYQVITNTGFDMDEVLSDNPETHQPDINWTSANTLAQNAATAAADPNSGVTSVTAEQARNLANSGIPVLAVADNPNGHGHAAIVAPSTGTVTMIGQAGATNGVMTLNSGFGSLAGSVHFYQFPPEKP